MLKNIRDAFKLNLDREKGQIRDAGILYQGESDGSINILVVISPDKPHLIGIEIAKGSSSDLSCNICRLDDLDDCNNYSDRICNISKVGGYLEINFSLFNILLLRRVLNKYEYESNQLESMAWMH